jgi:hypothetical protein
MQKKYLRKFLDRINRCIRFVVPKQKRVLKTEKDIEGSSFAKAMEDKSSLKL